MNSRILAQRRAVGTRTSPLRTTAGLLAALAAILPAAAANLNFYWTGDNNNLWNAATGPAQSNWSSSPDFNNGTGAVLPGVSNTSDVFFNLFGASNLNTQLGQDFTINSLTFTTDDTSPVTIGGANLLTIGAGGLTNNASAAAPATLSTNVALGANQVWTNNVAGNTLSASGIISGSGINLGLAGAGGFNFSGTNTYTGTTSLTSNGTSLTLSGANGSLATSSISLEGGTSLILDNTITNNANRILDTTGITSKGATIALKGASATETVGTLTLSTGTTRVNVDAGSTLTLSNNLNATRVIGSSVNFSTTGAIKIAGQTNQFNGIIGGYATIGNVGSVQQDANGNSNVLDFAQVDGSGNVFAFTAYDLNDFSAATKNTKVNGASTITAGTTVHINSLYLTGAARVTLGTTASAGNLIVDSGAIISNGATQTFGGSGPQIDLVNSADIGSGTVNATNTAGPAITGTLTSGTGDLVITTASNLRIDATITNNGANAVALTKNGSGTLDLSDGNGSTATNTYSGITTINGGLVTIRADRNLGAVPNVAGTATNTPNSITLNGGELRMTATITLDSHRGITVGPQGGIISYNGGNTTHLTGYLVTGSGAVQYSDIPSFGINVPPFPANSNVNRCAMDIGFTTTNYTGATTFFTQGSAHADPIDAVIYFSGNDKVPDASAVTVTNNDGKGILNLFGKSDTWGSLAGNGNILNGVATNSNLTVGGNNLSTTYSGSLGKVGVTWTVGANSTTGADNSTGSTSAITLTKLGSGTMTMSGVNGYTGATSVNGGTLLITGSLATTPVTVGNGTLTGALGGSGTIAGLVSVTSTGHLAPAISPSVTSTLTISNSLTLNAGATLDYNFGTTGGALAFGTSDTVKLQTGGSLALPNFASLTLNISQLAGFGVGFYDLIDSSAGSTFFPASGLSWTINGASNFNYAVLQPGDAAYPAFASNALVLQVLTGNPAFTWVGKVGAVNNGNWDLATANWTSAGAGNVYANGANVTFDDSASGTTTAVVQAGGVSPNTMTFTNGALNYAFSGGPISVSGGANSIVKTQAGSVTFNNSVTAPTTTVSGGSLVVGTGGTLNSPTVRVNSGGTLSVLTGGTLTVASELTVNGNLNFSNAAQSLVKLSDTAGATTGVINLTGTALTITTNSNYDGIITGTGSLTTGANSTLTLSNGGSTYSGGTSVTGSNAFLAVTNPTGSATGTGPVQVNSGGTLAGTGRIGGNLTLGADGHLAPAGNGTIGTLTIGGGTTLATGSVLDFDFANSGNNDTNTVGGALSIASGGNITLNVSTMAGFGPGSYPLFTAGSPVNTNGANFAINPFGPNAAPDLAYSVIPSGNQLLLSVLAISKTWTGTTNNVWDTATTNNWTPGGTWQDGVDALFDDTGLNRSISVDLGGVNASKITFNNSAAFPYTINGPGFIGGLAGIVKNNTGTVTLISQNFFTGPTTINAGILNINQDANLGQPPFGPTPGQLTIAGGTLQIASASAVILSAGRGVALGTGTNTIDVPAGSSLLVSGIVADVPTQTGTLTKISNGSLELGAANTYSGGTSVLGGSLQLDAAGSAGTGNVTLSANTKLILGAATQANTVSVNSATVGVSGGATVSGNVTVTGTSVLESTNPNTLTGSFDLILTGQLLGNGNITITGANGNGPDGSGVRLRGPLSSYSGIITVLPSGKFELQSQATQTTGSEMGTGTLVLTGGASTNNGNGGTFSLVNLRNNSNPNADIAFGNNVQVAGSGIVLFNMLGANGPGATTPVPPFKTTMGDLQIGGNQTAWVGSNGAQQILAFTSVHLTGGNATFAPHPVDAATGIPNTNYTFTEELRLGPISENVAGSGIVMNGASLLTLTGVNTYTGPTSVLHGTLALANGASIATSSSISVSTGAFLDVSALTGSTLAVPTAQSLTDNGTLTGAVSLSGTLHGSGIISGSLTALSGAHVGPGNSPGTLTTSNLNLQTGSTFDAELSKLTAGSQPIAGTDYDSLTVSDSTGGATPTVTLGGTLNTIVGTGLETGDVYTLILNNGADNVSGIFAGLNNGATFSSGGQIFQISYADNSATPGIQELSGGNDVSLLVVPEPGAATALLGGLACLLARRRRRY